MGISSFISPSGRKGLERAAPDRRLVQKLRAGEQFLARGRVHSRQTHSVGMSAACYLPSGVPRKKSLLSTDKGDFFQ